jgi:hypothetical protein
MVQKAKGAKVYKTMQGKQIDMDLLRKRNELTPAVGNVRMNARGDELGPGGQVVRKREEILKEYYENSTGVANELAVKKPVVKDLTDDWVEDDEGNFVPKGE